MSVCTEYLDPKRSVNVEFASLETSNWSNDHCNSDVLRVAVRPPLTRWCAIPGHWYDPRTVGLGLKLRLHSCRCWLAKAKPVGTSRHYRGRNSCYRVAWSGPVEWPSASTSNISIRLSPQAPNLRVNRLVSPEAGSRPRIHPARCIEPHSGKTTYQDLASQSREPGVVLLTEHQSVE
jgi:hypothetical protein